MHPANLTRDTRERLAKDIGSAAEPGMLYTDTGEGMSNQIDRFGLLPKKSMSKNKRSISWVRILPERVAGDGDNEDDATDEAGDVEVVNDSNITFCQTFNHPAYGEGIPFEDNKGPIRRDGPRFRIKLADLARGADSCGFCKILYNGINQYRDRWLAEWAFYRWCANDANSPDEAEAQWEWCHEHVGEVEKDGGIDEATVDLIIQFTKATGTVDVQIAMAEEVVPAAEGILTFMMLEFYSLIARLSLWSPFGPRTHTITNILEDGGVEDIVDWLRACSRTHPRCRVAIAGNKSNNPTRLIKIFKSENGAYPPFQLQLHETDPSLSYRYVALSHCWSRSNPLKTTHENLVQHQQSIPYDSLSPVFDNALHMTWCLNAEYLWIDSICIVQDDPDEWQRESARMGVVYSGAFIVLASHGYDFGLHRARLNELKDPWRPDDPPVFCRPLTDHSNLFIPPERTDSWFTRGWCIQERLLARRIVHFGGPVCELWYECNTEVNCECERVDEARDVLHSQTLKELRASLLYELEADDPTPDEVWKYYIRFVEDYSAGHLTYPSDRMPAMSSLMNELAGYLGHYYAGIWEHNLLLSLQWEAWDTRECERFSEYVAPSFSWTSRSGGVIYYFDLYTILEAKGATFAEVVDICCTSSTQDRFGRVNGGQLTLRGWVTRMSVKSTEQIEPDGRIELETEDIGECFATLDTLQDLEQLEVGDVLTCLDIMRDQERPDREAFVSGLVLLPSLDLSGCYRRVGFATMLAKQFDGAETETLVIV